MFWRRDARTLSFRNVASELASGRPSSSHCSALLPCFSRFSSPYNTMSSSLDFSAHALTCAKMERQGAEPAAFSTALSSSSPADALRAHGRGGGSRPRRHRALLLLMRIRPCALGCSMADCPDGAIVDRVEPWGGLAAKGCGRARCAPRADASGGAKRARSQDRRSYLRTHIITVAFFTHYFVSLPPTIAHQASTHSGSTEQRKQRAILIIAARDNSDSPPPPAQGRSPSDPLKSNA